MSSAPLVGGDRAEEGGGIGSFNREVRVSPFATSAVLAGLEMVRGWQEEFYRDLHAHPELSHQERRTAANVAQRLRAAGCDVREGVGGTGAVGLVRNGDGPTVVLRADMDALPVREATGLDYASTDTATTPDGSTPVM